LVHTLVGLFRKGRSTLVTSVKGRIIHAAVGLSSDAGPHAITSLAELLRQYFNIAFLMGRPQDLPVGVDQMKIGIVLALLTYTLALAIPFNVGRALAHAVVDIGFTAVVLYAALATTGRLERFQQSFGGYCGSSAVINAAAIPLYLSASATGVNDNVGLAGSAQFLLIVWSLSLLALIIRHTFEVGIASSVLLAFCWIVVLINVMAYALPSQQVTTFEPQAFITSTESLAGVSGTLVGGLLTVI